VELLVGVGRRVITFDPPGAFASPRPPRLGLALRLLRPVLGPIMRQREDRNLQAVKAALEQERGPSPPASDPL